MKRDKSSPWEFLWYALYAFAGLGLEMVLMGGVEPALFGGTPPSRYTAAHTLLHWGMTMACWGLTAALLVRQAEKKLGFSLLEARPVPRKGAGLAIGLAALCNLLGVLCVTAVNTSVAETIYSIASFGGGPRAALAALCAAMASIVLWAAAAWWFGIPTSESHALVAGISGAAAALEGSLSCIRWDCWARVVLGLLVFLLVRDVPGDLGLEPYHLGGPETPAPPPRPAPAGMTPALRLSLLLAVFLIGGPGGPGFSHLTVLYTTAGYDSASAALLISYLGLVICVSKILCGQIYDRFGSRAGNWYVHLVFLAGLLLCCLAHLGGMLPAFAAMTLFGLGLSISAVTFAIWSADLFGDAQYEGAVRSLTVSYALGMLLFGPIPGLLADRFHSYVPAYALFALCLAVSLVIIQRAYRKLDAGHRPRRD